MVRDAAEALAVALRNGFAEVADAVRWADFGIATAQTSFWHDLRCGPCCHASAVADLLEQLPGKPDHAVVMDLLIQLVQAKLQTGERGAESIARWLYQMALADNIKDASLRNVALAAGDALALVDAGSIGSRAEVINAMRQALMKAANAAQHRGQCMAVRGRLGMCVRQEDLSRLLT